MTLIGVNVCICLSLSFQPPCLTFSTLCRPKAAQSPALSPRGPVPPFSPFKKKKLPLLVSSSKILSLHMSDLNLLGAKPLD